MKKLLYLIPVFALFVACTPKVAQVTEAAAPAPVELNNFVDSVSYTIGSDMMNNLNNVLPEGERMFDREFFKLGMDESAEGKSRISTEDAKVLMQRFQIKLQQAQEARQKEEAAKAKEEAAKFFVENASKEGVMTTASGLQYKVLQEGTGDMPLVSDRVEVHYEGRLIDGTVFDSSYKRGTPAQFALAGVIKGWTEGLQLMKEGAKYQFFIPSDLGYGERGSPPKIGPGATLIFDVELLQILK